MEGWIKLASSAVLGAASAIVYITMWVGQSDSKALAHEVSIQRLQTTDNLFYDELRDLNEKISEIKERAARIEGKLDAILK